jgi:N-acetylmuramoyl-L-alanine amidase
MNKKYPAIFFRWYFIFFCVLVLMPEVISGQQDKSYKLKTLVIDPGHGGKDPGSVGSKTTESKIALAIALKAGKYIEDNIKDVKVIYTRKTDVFIPLLQRAEIANSNKADLIISIHVNALENPKISGTMTLVLGLHRAGENFEVAKKENSVILLEDDYHTKYAGFDPGDPESYIMFSLMQNLYFDQSINLAALVQDQFRERANRVDKGVRQQGLIVLAQSAMPGILIETGFLSNPDEEKYLMSEEGQDYLASAIYRAFRNYKDIIESRNTYLAAKADSITAEPDSTKDNDIIADNTDAVVPSQVEFKVQIAASSKKIPSGARELKGLNGVSEYKVGNLYKYAVGNYQTFKEVIDYSRQIKERFPDAFIIAVKDNKIIPLDQALKESSNN